MLAREDAKTFSVDKMHFQTSSECMFMTHVCSVFCSWEERNPLPRSWEKLSRDSSL